MTFKKHYPTIPATLLLLCFPSILHAMKDQKKKETINFVFIDQTTKKKQTISLEKKLALTIPLIKTWKKQQNRFGSTTWDDNLQQYITTKESHDDWHCTTPTSPSCLSTNTIKLLTDTILGKITNNLIPLLQIPYIEDTFNYFQYPSNPSLQTDAFKLYNLPTRIKKGSTLSAITTILIRNNFDLCNDLFQLIKPKYKKITAHPTLPKPKGKRQAIQLPYNLDENETVEIRNNAKNPQTVYLYDKQLSGGYMPFGKHKHAVISLETDDNGTIITRTPYEQYHWNLKNYLKKERAITFKEAFFLHLLTKTTITISDDILGFSVINLWNNFSQHIQKKLIKNYYMRLPKTLQTKLEGNL